jgi:hypothetical protein
MLIQNENWEMYKNCFPNFSLSELWCSHTHRLCMSADFLVNLQRLRARLDRPMIITSGCRTETYNSAIGGHKRSLHICDKPQHEGQKGSLAVDVAAIDPIYRGDLFSIAWREGWSIGWGKTFLHLDRRDTIGLPQNTFDY